jgi:hypothetical protein
MFMNFQQPNTTIVPQALLIRHGHNYFENGQTRCIKNLTYSLMTVDHNAIVRKTLLRKGGEGHRARIVFTELISTPTRCPQRVLVLDAERLITAARIVPATRMPELDVLTGLELLTSKEVIWITHVACHGATPSLSNLSTVACHTQPLTLTPQHPVACHTESVAIQRESTAATGITKPDVRAGTELIAIKKVKWILDVACHSAQRSSPNPTVVACHRSTPALSTPGTVACHTESVVIQWKLTPAAGMSESDVVKEPLLEKPGTSPIQV